MNSSRKAFLLVLAFGGLLGLIALLLINYRPPAPTGDPFVLTNPSLVLGSWNTRTVAEDDLNSAFSGKLVLGKDYYQIANPMLKTPVRIDNVQYRLEGDQVAVWVKGANSEATYITLLSRDRARISLPGNNLVLYMYREGRGGEK